jgi:hypothetical protein
LQQLGLKAVQRAWKISAYFDGLGVLADKKSFKNTAIEGAG